MLHLPKQSEIPRDLIVKDQVWHVKFVRKIPDPDYLCVGLADPSDKIIYIKTGLTPYERWRTFVHEVIHAIEFEWDFELPHDMIQEQLDLGLAHFIICNFGFLKKR